MFVFPDASDVEIGKKSKETLSDAYQIAEHLCNYRYFWTYTGDKKLHSSDVLVAQWVRHLTGVTEVKALNSAKDSDFSVVLSCLQANHHPAGTKQKVTGHRLLIKKES